jgi:hypothetical protein
MIASHCFKREWIDAKRSELGGGDPTLIEKTIHAFALLGHLARRRVPMVFKGGTSLMLRLPAIKRLSIDIDILCPLPDHELNIILREIATEPPFVRHEEDVRSHHRMPARRHFKFYYAPTDTTINPHVLLDVVKENPLHPHTDEVVILSSLFEIEEVICVIVPTIENLLGDKLTAFAPNTVGIPSSSNYVMQIMKQLFDIEVLFDVATDYEKVALAYNAIFNAENNYRGNRFSTVQALNDTIETARLLCHYNLRGSAQNERQGSLEKGRQALASHLIGGSFPQEKAKVAASKVAFLASCLRDGKAATISAHVPYDISQTVRLRDIVLSDAILHRLRGGNPEAFYYWALTLGQL